MVYPANSIDSRSRLRGDQQVPLVQQVRQKSNSGSLPGGRWSQLPTETSKNLLMVSKCWHLSICCGAVKSFFLKHPVHKEYGPKRK